MDGLARNHTLRHCDMVDGGTDVTIEELIEIERVVAVEVYSGAATVPQQWGGSQGNRGVIQFWTVEGGR